MRTWISRVAVVGSAVTCLLFAAGWAASLFVTTGVDYTWVGRHGTAADAVTAYVRTPPHQFTLGVRRIAYDTRHAFVPLSAVAPDGLTWQRSAPVLPDGWHRFGFAVTSTARPNRGFGDERNTAATVPFWLPMSLAALLPARAAVRLVRRRGSPGACRHCGYDKRASPARCPECGR